jgi:UDP-N-acetylglucosamine 2-epimerase
MTKKILYLIDSEKISEKTLEEINLEKNCEIICLNHIIDNEFKKYKIKTLNEKEILKISDYLEIDELAHNISKKWCKNNQLEKDLTYKKINLGLTIQNELFQNLLKYIHRIFLVKKSLEIIKPNLVFTTFSNEILDSIAYEICISNKIEIQKLDELPKRFENKFDKVNFALNILGKNIELSCSENQFKILKKIYEFISSLKFNIMTIFDKKEKKTKTILFLDFNLNWHESLIEKYFNLGFNILCLNNRRPLLWSNNSLKIAKKFKIEKISLQKSKEEIDFNEIIKKINFKNSDLENLFKIKEFNFWKIYENELTNICKKRFKETINLIIQVEKLLNSRKIDLVWALDDWGFDKTIVNLCKNKKIPTCLFLAGSLQILKPEGKLWPMTFAKQRIADKIFLWGENDMKNAIECGADPKKLVIGGAPKYDKIFFESKKSEEYILILTGGFPSTAYSYFNSTFVINEFKELFEKTLEEVKKLNKKIIIKRHPTQGPQEILDIIEIIKRIIPDALILKNANTIELVSNASLIITVNSTVLEESIILDKPVIYLPYIKNDIGIPYSKLNAVIEISNPEKIEESIHNCLFDNITKKKLENGRKELLEKIISFQGYAAEKHVELSLKLIDGAQKNE